MRWNDVLAALVLTVPLAGCIELPITTDSTKDTLPTTTGDDDDDDDTNGDDDDDTNGDCAEATIGAAGGEIALGDDVVTVPAGALDADADVTLCVVPAPAGVTPASAVLELGPTDLALTLPVSVHLTHTAADGVALFVPGPAGDAVRQVRAVAGPDAVDGPQFRPGVLYAAAEDALTVPYLPGNTAIDILFVLDNSCSMYDEQVQLADNFARVLPTLEDAGADYHVGVVSTDMDGFSNVPGALEQVASRRWVDPTHPDPARLFEQMTSLGTLGSGTEQGLGAGYTAIELLGSTDNAGFIREEATLSIIVVSDENDYTPASLVTSNEFVAWLDALKPDPALSRFDTVASVSGFDISRRYIDIANTMGGLVQDILAPDWTPFLQTIVDDLVAVGGMVVDPPVAGFVEVWWVSDDTNIEPVRIDPAAVQLDTVTGAIVVDESAVPAGAGELLVVYQP